MLLLTVQSCGAKTLTRGCFVLFMLLQSTGMSDLNPLTRSVLASPDAVSSTKILLMKMFIVMAAGCLDSFPTIQVVIVTLAVVAVCLIHLQDVSA